MDTAPAETASQTSSSRGNTAFIASIFSILYLLVLSATAYPTVFPPGREARLAGPDAYFHLRQAETVLANYPRIVRHDTMTNFPKGEYGMNQGFFDLSVATASKLSLGLLSPKIILIWVSPLLALITILWCGRWLSKEVSNECALFFLLFSLAYPASLNSVAALGQGDHHAYELASAAAIAWSLAWLFRPSTSWKKAPLAALPLIWLYFSWAGAPLQLFLVGLVFYFRAWNPEISDEKLVHKSSAFALTLLLVVLGMNALVPWATIWSASYQIFLLGGVLLLAGYPILVALAKRTKRFPLLGALGTLLIGLALMAAHPTTREYLFLLGEERSTAISEHALISLGLLNAWYGPLWILAIFGLLLILGRRKFWWASVPLLYAGGLVLFWLQTRDFVYYTPPAIAAAAAYALAGWKRRKLLQGVAAAVAVVPVLPFTGVHTPWMSVPMAQEAMLVSDGLESASAWLREVHKTKGKDEDYGLIAPWDLGNILAQTTDTPVGWSQTLSVDLARALYSDRPEVVYQVLATGPKPFRFIYLPARNLSEKYISELGVAGIPVGAEFAAEQTLTWNDKPVTTLKTLPRHDQALLNRLYWKRGKDLGNYRLIFETAEQSLHTQKLHPAEGSVELHSLPLSKEEIVALKPLFDFPNIPLETSRGVMVKGRLAPEVRIFEFVPGAEIVGSGPPGRLVSAELELYSPNTGKTWTASWSAKTDSKGQWSLILPYPTDTPMSKIPGTVEVHGQYHILVGQKALTFSLEESMIRSGSTLRVGNEKFLSSPR